MKKKFLIIGVDEVGRAAKRRASPKIIIGIDEVGRGALAGPITVAAMAATVHSKSPAFGRLRRPAAGKRKSPSTGSGQANLKILEGIKDSKKLSPRKRQEWLGRLTQEPAFVWAIASVGPQTIDRIGIVAAAHVAVTRALAKLRKSGFLILSKSDFHIFLDGGLKAPGDYYNQQTVIKGDEKIPLIAAASIVAKVHRDRFMVRVHKKFPLFGFDRHKGYGTFRHRTAIKENGACVLHRQRFLTKIL